MNLQMMQAYFLFCPNCHHKIALPHQSRIEIYEGQRYQPKGKWPLNYLCSACGRLSQVEQKEIRWDFAAGTNLSLGKQALWWIDCECGHENCTGNFSLCYKHLEIEMPSQVCEIVASISPAVGCGIHGHRFEFRADKMHAEKMDS
jgi:hypothetical protein